MKWNDDVRRQLAAPFPAEEIKWRPGKLTKDKAKGMPLAYIDARAVMDRLDDVVGPENWENNFTVTPTKNLCALTVLGVTKCDGAEDTSFEGPKGGLSDSFKRAAVHFGIGRYLYNLGDQKWLPVDSFGKFKQTPKLPEWALPAGERVVSIVKDKPSGGGTSVEAAEEILCREEEDDSQRERMIAQINKLLAEGMNFFGSEEFLGRVNVIMKGYTEGSWQEMPIEEGRKMYTDIAKMIETARREG